MKFEQRRMHNGVWGDWCPYYETRLEHFLGNLGWETMTCKTTDDNKIQWRKVK